MKDVEWHHSEFQQHSVTRRITLRYCGVLCILHAVPQISSSVLRHNTASACADGTAESSTGQKLMHLFGHICAV